MNLLALRSAGLAAALSLQNWRSSFVGVLENTRSLQDVNLLKTIALPAAGATANSASIDLNTTTAGRAPRVELRVQIPATPSLADTKSVTAKVQDSADNLTFADVAEMPVVTQGPASGGTGGAAIDRKFKLPIGIRQFVRMQTTVDAAGGNNTGVTATLSLVF